MYKYIYSLLLALAIPIAFMSAASAIAVENTSSTTAGQDIAQCNGGNLSGWDWPKEIRELPHVSGTKTTDGLFDPATTDYIIYMTQTQATGDYRSELNGNAYQYTVIDAGSGGNLTMFSYGGQNYVSNRGSQNQNLSSYRFTLIDSYKVTHGTYYPLAVDLGLNQGNTSVASSNALYGTYTFWGSSVACVVAMHGVTYDPSYTGPKFKSSQAFTENAGNACSPLNVACHMANAFQTVTSGIAEFAREVMQWFIDLFVPDPEQTQAAFDDLGDFLNAKLGFLTYPFEFMGELFDAFQNGGTWCSPSDCKFTASTMNGGSLSMDLLYLKHSGFSSMWDWAILFIRGTSIVVLLGMLQRRLQEVMQR